MSSNIQNNNSSKKIVFVTNSSKYFFSHRISLANFLLENGFNIVAITKIDSSDKIQDKFSANFKLINWNIDRKSFYPIKELYTLIKLFFLIKQEKPDCVHSMTIKSVIYSGIVCRILGLPMVSLIPGLGTAFTYPGIIGFFLKKIAIFLYKISLNNKDFKIFFENNDNKETFIKLKILNPNNAITINGSGIDIEKFKFKPRNFQDNTKRFVLMAARLIKDKGLIEYIEAAKIIAKERSDIQFILAGEIDPGNITSFSKEEILAMLNGTQISYIGYQKNILEILEQAHIFCLPSYHEGLPVSVLEALASGAIVVTSNVPGCRDAVLNGKIGYTVQAKNPLELANAILEISNFKSYPQIGYKARLAIEEIFSSSIINNIYLNTYMKILNIKH
ncbi:glycosyltransferase family 4 protein [Fluviispira vulneris]|uniref:glycosyltransferase family 4 protein n=1 Tax=Fluviispira vulneris TaxID=2763012 RepID=UPI001644B7EC|nr:glycosyltransferase family 4 protein [Fluviispira vulneris]